MVHTCERRGQNKKITQRQRYGKKKGTKVGGSPTPLKLAKEQGSRGPDMQAGRMKNPTRREGDE